MLKTRYGEIRQRLPIQFTENTYVLFIGSCQPASFCYKTHFFSSCWLGNSTPSYQFTRCVAEARLGMVLPPYLVLCLGNVLFLYPLFIMHSEFKAERTAFPLVTGMTVSVSWTCARCKWLLLFSH